jgi:SAM-dependent methyltransferase
MHNAGLRRFFSPLKRTPLHPQWFVFRREMESMRETGSFALGNVLDIGAGSMQIQNFLTRESFYTALDYLETAVGWYGTLPHVFGDGQSLPIRSCCIDTVLILDVLEHLPRSDEAMKEIKRVLRPGGRVIIQVPFLYPTHDSPRDFQRWTIHGLRNLAAINDFAIVEETTSGNPLETAALLSNIAVSKTVLSWVKTRNPMLVFSFVLLLSIPFSNLAALFLSAFSRRNTSFMPHSIRCVWVKQ